ncbi:unnamed protein product, partial [Chrysoparadoxa australica]
MMRRACSLTSAPTRPVPAVDSSEGILWRVPFLNSIPPGAVAPKFPPFFSGGARLSAILIADILAITTVTKGLLLLPPAPAAREEEVEAIMASLRISLNLALLLLLCWESKLWNAASSSRECSAESHNFLRRSSLAS